MIDQSVDQFHQSIEIIVKSIVQFTKQSIRSIYKDNRLTGLNQNHTLFFLTFV
jgi:hypothetical protein